MKQLDKQNLPSSSFSLGSEVQVVGRDQQGWELPWSPFAYQGALSPKPSPTVCLVSQWCLVNTGRLSLGCSESCWEGNSDEPCLRQWSPWANHISLSHVSITLLKDRLKKKNKSQTERNSDCFYKKDFFFRKFNEIFTSYDITACMSNWIPITWVVCVEGREDYNPIFSFIQSNCLWLWSLKRNLVSYLSFIA